MLLMTSILQSLIDLDTSLFLTVNGVHGEYFDQFMYAYSGKLVWIPMYACIFYLMILNFTRRQLLFAAIGVGLVILFADQMCSHLIRPWVERWRPGNPNSPICDLVHIVNGYRGGRYGFPSCHAANTFALATYVMLLFRHRWLTCFLMGWAIVTCYSRVYLGVHYPGDLLVGGLVGALGAVLVYWLLCRFAHYQRPATLRRGVWPVWTGLLTILGIFIYAACITL